MQNKHLNIPYRMYGDESELASDEQQLLSRALDACENAYAPFSNFQVGAAVLLEGGEIVLGNNQENKAFPSGLCAERVAFFAIGASGKGAMIQKVAIRATSSSKIIDAPTMPCGACRQVMLEYEEMGQMEIVVLMQGTEGDILRVEGVAKSLLPFHFNTDFL